MNMKYFIMVSTTVFTFSLVPAAQGEGLLISQKLADISFKDPSLNKGLGDHLSEILLKEFSHIDHNNWEEAKKLKLESVALKRKKRHAPGGGRRERPKLSRGPMSY
ncbi:hypothetical protein [Bartonella sp. B30(2025)]